MASRTETVDKTEEKIQSKRIAKNEREQEGKGHSDG
jgi:hypothetical protein